MQVGFCHIERSVLYESAKNLILFNGSETKYLMEKYELFYIPRSNSLIFGHSVHKVFMQNIGFVYLFRYFMRENY